MRLLFLTNFYPPLAQGGYEQWCQEVAEGLRNRGHDIRVLTSRYRREDAPGSEPDWVCRDLCLEMDFVSLRNGIRFFTSRKKREQTNLTRLRQVIKSHAPDIVFVWGMWNLPRSLPALAETLLPGRVVYYIGDYWPTLPNQFHFYWQASARSRLAYVPKRVLGLLAHRLLSREKLPDLAFARTLFCTAFLRDELKRQGMSWQEARVIYGAIDTARYAEQSELTNRKLGKPMQLLYVGRLRSDKGVHTAIEAVDRLVHHHGLNDVRLRIAGVGEPDYRLDLCKLVSHKQLRPFVTFLGVCPPETMPHLYRESDILLFTSIWPEPFGRVLVEAMAAGVVVVGACTGGASEILNDGENALTFTPGDANELATQVLRLAESPELRQRLIENGRRTAIEKFDIGRMVTEIEEYLQICVDDPLLLQAQHV